MFWFLPISLWFTPDDLHVKILTLWISLFIIIPIIAKITLKLANGAT